MISFNADFDDGKLCSVSTIKCAEAILRNTTNDVVTQVDLVGLVAIKLGMSEESVRGTILGGDLTPPKHKLRGNPYFISAWVVSKSSSKRIRFVRKTSTYLNPSEIVTPTYDTKSKAAARERGCLWCVDQIEKFNPIIATLAGPEAVCATAMLKRKPNAIISNVDTNAAVLKQSAKLGLLMTNHHMDISDFIRRTPYLDLLNYDTDGYFCETLVENLRRINSKYLANYISLTIHGHDKIRNHGTFSDNFRRHHSHKKNAILRYLVDLMSNYDLLDEFIYHRNEDKISPMRTMIYKLQDDKLEIITNHQKLLTF